MAMYIRVQEEEKEKERKKRKRIRRRNPRHDMKVRVGRNISRKMK
jgi:hypothetical protein